MKIGLVGCGVIAALHAEIISEIPGSTLVAVADCDLAKAAAFAEDYSRKFAPASRPAEAVHAYVSLEEMLEEEALDIVHICTPHYLHVPMAVYCLEKGVHVFLEKPPAISREDFAKLEKVNTDRSLGFCFQNRYNDCVKYVQAALAKEETGKVLGARAFVSWSRGKAYYEASPWRGRLDQEGGGVLINQSIHTLDLLVNFLGVYEWAEASMSNHHLKGQIEVEDTMEAYIQFAACPATFYATTAYAVNAPILVELECENVRIRLEGNLVSLTYRDGRREDVDFTEASIGKSYYGNGHIRAINDFYASVAEGRPAPIGLADVQETMRLMMDLYDTARGRV